MHKVTILYDASQAILTTFEPDEVLQRILTIVRDYFHLQKVGIFLLDEKTHELALRSQIGWETGAEVIRIPLGTGLTGTAAKIKRPVYAPDVLKDPRYQPPLSGTSSALAIPLMVGDSVAGVLDCQSDRPSHFDRETVDLLTLFSTQASMALQNARLYTLEQKRAAQLRAINAVAKRATAVLELDELMRSVCDLVRESFPCDHACVLLTDADTLVARAQNGSLTPGLETGYRFPAIPDAWKDALASGGILNEDDLSGIFGHQRLSEQAFSRLCIPLIAHRQPLGLLILSSGEKNFFDSTDVQPLESVADIFASAIQNAHYVETVQQLAFLDGLTGIFNRRYFETRIQDEMERAKRYHTELSIVMVDVDHFKRLNDEFGHMLGDEVLRQVSSLLSQRVRKTDVVCRYGGEEFVILLPQTAVHHAVVVADKLRCAIADWEFPGVSRPLTISAGVAEFPDHATTRDDLLQAADAALYAAKQAGRNRVLAATHTTGVGA